MAMTQIEWMGVELGHPWFLGLCDGTGVWWGVDCDWTQQLDGPHWYSERGKFLSFDQCISFHTLIPPWCSVGTGELKGNQWMSLISKENRSLLCPPKTRKKKKTLKTNHLHLQVMIPINEHKHSYLPRIIFSCKQTASTINQFSLWGPFTVRDR